MKRLIHFLKKKLFEFRFKGRDQITGKGEYLLKYILDKYLNEDNPDDWNEEYENTIEEFLIRREEANWFARLEELNDIELFDDDKRFFSAVAVFATITYSCEPENREKYLNMINSKANRTLVENFW